MIKDMLLELTEILKKEDEYEYRIVTIPNGKLIKTMNELWKDWWDCIHIDYVDGCKKNYLFKRRIK